MFWELLKKEIKQFSRSKGDLIMLFAFPIVLITILSVGLKDIMDGTANVFEDDIVYYKISEQSEYSDGLIMFKDSVESKYDIEFKEIESQDKAKKAVDKGKALLYISVDSNGYKMYRANDENFSSKMLRSIFQVVMNEYDTYTTIAEYNPQQMSNLIEKQYDSYIEEQNGKCKKGVTSAEYYTFAELALIILYISATVGEHVAREEELTTINRIRMSKVSERQIVLSKVSLGIIIGIIQVLLVYVYSSTILKVDWGESTLKLLVLFLDLVVFSSVLGAILGLVIKKAAVLNGLLQVLIVFFCALGGCYVPIHVLIISPVLAQIVKISPMYWINVATSTMVCGYESDAYKIALIILAVMSIIMILIYLIGFNKKEGEKDA